MVAQVPVLAIGAALKVIEYQVVSNHDKAETRRHDQLVELKMRELEAADLRHQRQSEVLMRLAKMSQQTQNMQMDILRFVFTGVKDLLTDQQNMIAEEKRALTEKIVAPETTPQAHALLSRRQRDLDRELEGIRETILQLASTSIALVGHLGNQMSETDIKALEEISSNVQRN